MAALLVAATAAVWLGLPAHARADFSWLHRITILGVLAVPLAGLYGLFRTVVRAEDDGLTVVNLYRRRDFEWPAVVGISLGHGQPWALLDIADGTTVGAMAIQGSDGKRAIRAVRELSVLLAERAGTERLG